MIPAGLRHPLPLSLIIALVVMATLASLAAGLDLLDPSSQAMRPIHADPSSWHTRVEAPLPSAATPDGSLAAACFDGTSSTPLSPTALIPASQQLSGLVEPE
jgi:hypothetical protein